MSPGCVFLSLLCHLDPPGKIHFPALSFPTAPALARPGRDVELFSIAVLGQAQHFYFPILLQPPGMKRVCVLSTG